MERHLRFRVCVAQNKCTQTFWFCNGKKVLKGYEDIRWSKPKCHKNNTDSNIQIWVWWQQQILRCKSNAAETFSVCRIFFSSAKSVALKALFEERFFFHCMEIITASPISLPSFELLWFLAQISYASSPQVYPDFWCWRANTADHHEGQMKVGKLQNNMTLHSTTSWLGRKQLWLDNLCHASLNLTETNAFLCLKG